MKALVLAVSLSLGSLGAAQLDLEWIDAATGETSYTVQWSKEPDYDPLIGSANLEANTESYSIVGLENNTLYYVRVYSSNTKGDSDHLEGSQTTAPAAPSSLSASNADGSKVSLSWAAPAGGADSYKVEYKRAVDSTWIEFASGVTDLSDTVSGLDGETLYSFRVRGTTIGGDGSYSNIDSVTTGVALLPLLVETFEGSEVVSGGTGTADNSGWSANNAVCDFDYSSSPIAGSKSFQSNFHNYQASHPISPAGTELWIYFRFRGADSSSLEEKLLRVVDENGNECMRVYVRSAYQEVYMSHGSVVSTGNIDNWSGAHTDYSIERHVRIQWEKGSGTDGTMRMWTSADGSFSVEPERVITTGNGNYTPATVSIHGGSDAVIDNLYVSDDEIGSNPSFGGPAGEGRPKPPGGLELLD